MEHKMNLGTAVILRRSIQSDIFEGGSESEQKHQSQKPQSIGNDGATSSNT